MSKNKFLFFSVLTFIFAWIPFLGFFFSLYALFQLFKLYKQEGQRAIMYDDKRVGSVGIIIVSFFIAVFSMFNVFGDDTKVEKTPVEETEPVVIKQEEEKKKNQELENLQNKIKSEKQKLEELEELEKQRLAKEAEQAKLEEQAAAKAAAEEQARLQAEAEEKSQQEAAALATQKAQQEQSTQPITPVSTTVYYKNCTEARAAGAAPIHQNEPGYARHLDRDGDGIGCDK